MRDYDDTPSLCQRVLVVPAIQLSSLYTLKNGWIVRRLSAFASAQRHPCDIRCRAAKQACIVTALLTMTREKGPH